MIKFSIITVCLNSSKTIRRCLESVTNQTYKNFEHIIIDGKSQDDTLSMLSEFQLDKIISEEDDGIYYAMNKGINIAEGEYILFLNSDDVYQANYLEELSKVANGYDFISFGVNLVYPKKNIKWLPDSNILSNKYFWSMPMPHPGLAVLKKVVDDIGGFDTRFRLAADYDFILRMFKKTRNGYLSNQVLVDFYAGGQSQKHAIVRENYHVRKSNYGFSIYLYFAFLKDLIRQGIGFTLL